MMPTQVDTQLLAARRIVILTHIAPDADAIGGLLSLGAALRALGKTVVMACSDPVPERYAMLPGSAEIANQIEGTFDLLVSLDCSDERRMGRLYRPESWRHLPRVNIDHHISNTRFGSINWVDPEAVATCELVLELIDRLGAPLDTATATCLLYGIVGDTLALRTPNVSPMLLAKIIRLMHMGALLHQAVADLFQRRPLGQLAVWGLALSRMTIEGQLAWVAISAQERQRCGYPSTDGLQLPSLLLEGEGINVSAVMLEDDDGEVEISLRARNGFDVSGLAVELGGGGHPSAAGARVAGPLDSIVARIVQRLVQWMASSISTNP